MKWISIYKIIVSAFLPGPGGRLKPQGKPSVASSADDVLDKPPVAAGAADDVLTKPPVASAVDDVLPTPGAKSIRDELLGSVSNDKLRNCIDQMYRPGATTGDGGLADAVRHELQTDTFVGGKSHIIKANERVKNLENVIGKQNLNSSDRAIAEQLLRDLKNALEGK